MNLSQKYHVTLRERSYATDTCPGRKCRGESRTFGVRNPSRSLSWAGRRAQDDIL